MLTNVQKFRHSVRYILTCSAFGLASKESWWRVVMIHMSYNHGRACLQRQALFLS